MYVKCMHIPDEYHLKGNCRGCRWPHEASLARVFFSRGDTFIHLCLRLSNAMNAIKMMHGEAALDHHKKKRKILFDAQSITLHVMVNNRSYFKRSLTLELSSSTCLKMKNATGGDFIWSIKVAGVSGGERWSNRWCADHYQPLSIAKDSFTLCKRQIQSRINSWHDYV